MLVKRLFSKTINMKKKILIVIIQIKSAYLAQFLLKKIIIFF